MKSNIPIHRAKKIDSDEWVKGFLQRHINNSNKRKGINYYSIDEYEIDSTTLSIHFADMLDSDNKPIFASLQKDGKGGDILKSHKHYFSIHDEWVDYEEAVKMEYGSAVFDNCSWSELETINKVTGIQK